MVLTHFRWKMYTPIDLAHSGPMSPAGSSGTSAAFLPGPTCLSRWGERPSGPWRLSPLKPAGLSMTTGPRSEPGFQIWSFCGEASCELQMAASLPRGSYYFTPCTGSAHLAFHLVGKQGAHSLADDRECPLGSYTCSGWGCSAGSAPSPSLDALLGLQCSESPPGWA